MAGRRAQTPSSPPHGWETTPDNGAGCTDTNWDYLPSRPNISPGSLGTCLGPIPLGSVLCYVTASEALSLLNCAAVCPTFSALSACLWDHASYSWRISGGAQLEDDDSLEDEELTVAPAGKHLLQRMLKRFAAGISAYVSKSRRAAPGHSPQWPIKWRRLTLPFL